MTTPLGYLLTIWGHLVRPRVRPLRICPQERNGGRYPKLVLDRLLAALSVVDELDPSALSPRRIFPPSSSSSSRPGSKSSLFKSTLYTLSTAAAIAHWVFLYHIFTSLSFSPSSLLTFSWLPSLSFPPRDTSHAEAFAHVWEWDAVNYGLPWCAAAPQPCANEDHECRWVGERGVGFVVTSWAGRGRSWFAWYFHLQPLGSHLVHFWKVV